VDTATNLQVHQTQNGSVPSSLFSHYLLPPLSPSSLFVEPLGAILCSFGDRQCCGLYTTVICHCFPLIRSCAFAPNPQPWILLLLMSITGHCQQEQEYGYLSYLYHVILSLDGVNHLVHTVTKGLGTHLLTNPFPFPVFPPMSTLSEFVALSKLSSILVCHSLHWMLSAHGTRKPALLCPQNLPCACDGVLPEYCISLVPMLCEAFSLGIYMSSGVRLNLVSDFLPHIFLYTVLIPVHSPRLFFLFLHILHPTPPPCFRPLLFSLGPDVVPFHHKGR